jgi:hypothetical protein
MDSFPGNVIEFVGDTGRPLTTLNNSEDTEDINGESSENA